MDRYLTVRSPIFGLYGVQSLVLSKTGLACVSAGSTGCFRSFRSPSYKRPGSRAPVNALASAVWRVEVVSIVIALTTGGRAVGELLRLSYLVLRAAMLFSHSFTKISQILSQTEAAHAVLLLENNQAHIKPLCLSF